MSVDTLIAADNPGAALDIGPVPARLVPLFCFLHVPKTAGSSLRWTFSQMFGPHLHFFQTSAELALTPENEALWADPAFYNRHLMMGGHIWRRHPIMSPEAPVRRMIYLSVFRDPVQRAVSGYDFARRYQEHPMRDYLSDKTLLEAVSEDGPFRRRFVGDQLRYVFGTPDPARAARVLAEGDYIVAPMDKLDAFVDAVAAVSGLPRPPEIPRRNKAEDLSQSPLERASDQPGHAEALARIAEATEDERAFLDTHVRDVVVTTRLVPLP